MVSGDLGQCGWGWGTVRGQCGWGRCVRLGRSGVCSSCPGGLVYRGSQWSTSARIPPGTGDSLPSKAALSVRASFLSPGRVGRGLGLGSEDLVLRSCLNYPAI